MTGEPSASETADPDGFRVILKDEIWREKLVRDHPEIAEHRADVLRTVSAPDHVASDPIFEQRKRYYARGVGPSRWLLVVVSYEQTPARIVSAFANRKDPKSWSA
jgi:predicted ester cyclase